MEINLEKYDKFPQFKELDHIHQVLLKLLLDFDKLCKDNQIQYYLGGGTLLGAIRHKGFIPWDDDVDVMMTREEYDRLLSLPAEAFPEHLFLQTCWNDKDYHGEMAKLRLNGTLYSTEYSSYFSEMHNGFFIDIFAHDRTAENKTAQERHIFLTRLARSFVYRKCERTSMYFDGRYKWICKVATVLKELLPFPVWEYLRERTYLLYKNSSSDYLYDGMGKHLKHGVFPAEWLEKSIDWPFEGYMFPVPEAYDAYLKFSYGNYMELPEDITMESHKIKEIDFGNY